MNYMKQIVLKHSSSEPKFKNSIMKLKVKKAKYKV